MRRLVALATLLFAVSLASQPAEAHILFGDLKVANDSHDVQLPQVFRVVLKELGGRVLQRETVSPGGRYRFQDVSNGDYILSVEVENREMVRIQLRIDEFRETDIRRDLALTWKGSEAGAPDTPPGSATRFARERKQQDLFDEAQRELAESDLDAAIDSLKELVASSPQDYEAWTELGSAYFRDESLKESEECYDRAVEIKPDYLLAFLNRGKVQIAGERYEEAIASLLRTTQLDPEQAEAFYLLGEAYLQSRQGSKSIEAFTKSLELAPIEMADAHLRMASLYRAAGYQSHAAAEYEQFLAKRPDYPQREGLEKFIAANKAP